MINAAQCRGARALIDWSIERLATASVLYVEQVAAFETEGSLHRAANAQVAGVLEEGGASFRTSWSWGRRASQIRTSSGQTDRHLGKRRRPDCRRRHCLTDFRSPQSVLHPALAVLGKSFDDAATGQVRQRSANPGKSAFSSNDPEPARPLTICGRPVRRKRFLEGYSTWSDAAICPASDAAPEAAGPYGSSRTGSISPTACSQHSGKPWFSDPVSPTVAPYLPSTDSVSDDLWSALAYAAAATGAL